MDILYLLPEHQKCAKSWPFGLFGDGLSHFAVLLGSRYTCFGGSDEASVAMQEMWAELLLEMQIRSSSFQGATGGGLQ